MGNQGKLFERVMMKAALPDEPVPGLPLVEVMGRGRVLIENHLSVLCYNREEIRVKTKQGCICVCGDGMTLAQMTKHRLIILGKICSVSFERG